MWGRQWLANKSAGKSNFQLAMDFQGPGWLEISIALFVFPVGEKGWDSS